MCTATQFNSVPSHLFIVVFENIVAMLNKASVLETERGTFIRIQSRQASLFAVLKVNGLARIIRSQDFFKVQFHTNLQL